MRWTSGTRSRPWHGAGGLVVVLLVSLVGASASAQEASTAPSGSTVSPSDDGSASPRPSELPSSVVDDDGRVVSNATILATESRLVDLVAELGEVADGETRAERDATVARDQLAAADRRVAGTAREADDARDQAARATRRSRAAEGRLATAREALDEAVEDLATTERALEESRRVLQARLRATWMQGGRPDMGMVVLGMDDFNEVSHARQLLGHVIDNDNQVVADYLRLEQQRTDRLAAAADEEDRVAAAVAEAKEREEVRARSAADADAAADAARTSRQERARVLDEVRVELRELGESRLVVEEEIDRATAQLQAEVELELQRRREEAERQREEAERQRQEAERQREEAERRRVAEQRRVEAGLTKDEARAADLRARHQERVADAAATGQVPPDVSLPAANCGSRSQWVWPVAGCITSRFGLRDHPILDTRRLHAGVDVPAASGTPIVAVADGRVHRAGWSSGGHGNVVVIDHGEVATLYAHQVRVDVSAGQQVVAGQVIGWVGSTGLSTGPHLHLETHLDGPYGTPVDPAPWFRRG